MSNLAAAFLGIMALIIIPLGCWKFIEVVYYTIKGIRQGRFRFVRRAISTRELLKRIKRKK